MKETAKSKAKNAGAKVRSYFASVPPDGRRRLKKFRDTIRSAAPGAVEVISYGIPAFKLDGRMLVWYAAWQNHTSLYPMTGAIRGALAADIEGYETAKGTIRFPLAKPFPTALVRKLVKARVAELHKTAK